MRRARSWSSIPGREPGLEIAERGLRPALTEHDLSCQGDIQGVVRRQHSAQPLVTRFGSSTANVSRTTHWQSDCVASRDFQPQRHRVHRVVTESLLCPQRLLCGLNPSVVEYSFPENSMPATPCRARWFAMGHHRRGTGINGEKHAGGGEGEELLGLPAHVGLDESAPSP